MLILDTSIFDKESTLNNFPDVIYEGSQCCCIEVILFFCVKQQSFAVAKIKFGSSKMAYISRRPTSLKLHLTRSTVTKH